MKLKYLSLFILGIFMISLVSAVCTVTFDKESYIVGETITAAMMCTEQQEKNDAYELNWTYSNGTVVESDTGTTPAIVNENFYQTYVIPSGWPSGIWINASLTGTEGDLEGNDSANITAAGGGGVNTLEITNTTFGGGYLGLVSSIKATIKDETGKRVSGGLCEVSALSNDETRVLIDIYTTPINGVIEISDIFPPARFNEREDYAYEIQCYCGSAGSSTECIDEDGYNINNSIGSAKNFFTTQSWLNVNTVTDRSLYGLKDNLFVCANVTNLNYSYRIPMHIYYQIRCSKGTDNNSDTDRILIDFNSEDDPDARGISVNTTQMQCIQFTIPEEEYLMGSNSECYASTNVWVLNNAHEEILGYATTSPVFNISSDELNLQGDWQWESDTTINTIINLSNYPDISGTGIGNVDIRVDFPNEAGVELHHDISSLNLIENITIYNLTGVLIEHTDYEMEILEDGYLELELREVDLSSNWWNITLGFYDLELRQTEALEGIENKTGTFHLDVNCPPSGYIGENMECTITAYIEESQTVQKEVDFTCYITDGILQYSAVNFNQMVTRNTLLVDQTFSVPSTLNLGQQYLLQCHADYYSLGSRRDSFYDTFTASATPGGDASSSGGNTGEEGDEEDSGSAPITGDIIGEGDEEDSGEIIDKINPFSPERSYAFIFGGLIILIGIIFFIFILFRKRKNRIPSHSYNRKIDWKNFTKKFFTGIIIFLVLFLFFLGINYGYGFVKESFLGTSEKSISENLEGVSYILSGENLVKEIFLIFILVLVISLIIIFFTFLLVLVIAKLLNLRGEFRFGKGNNSRFSEDKKSSELQKKLNRIILKNEIKKENSKQHYFVRKISSHKKK